MGRDQNPSEPTGISCHNQKMAIQQAAAQALASVQRARALFGTPPSPPPEAPSLDTAAQSLTGAGQRTAGLSGELVDRHHAFVGAARRVLTGNADTDTALNQQLGAAIALTTDGGQRLDSIVERTRALARTAATARSPAAQRAVLAALHTEVSQADAVVDDARQHAAGIAGQIRSLAYQSGKHGSSIRNADFAEAVARNPHPMIRPVTPRANTPKPSGPPIRPSLIRPTGRAGRCICGA